MDASGQEDEFESFGSMGLRSRLDSIGAPAPRTNVLANSLIKERKH